MRIVYRRLRDGGVVFDGLTWRTHLLTPAAAIMLEALLEQAGDRCLPLAEAERLLETELGLDPRAPDVRQALEMFQDLAVIEAA
jgi:hypothetical protein